MYHVDPWAAVLFLALLGGARAWDWWQDRTALSDEEAIRQAYAEGEIDEAEMERRLAYVLDDHNEEIVEALTRVPDVGPKKARGVAMEFSSLDAVRTADHDELTAVHGVGESTANAIQERFGS